MKQMKRTMKALALVGIAAALVCTGCASGPESSATGKTRDFEKAMNANDFSKMETLLRKSASKIDLPRCMYIAIAPADYEWLRGFNENNTIPVLKLIIRYGGDVNEPFNSQPLLVWSIPGDRIDVVQFLLEQKADPNQADGRGQTALHYAFDNFETARLLLEHGADPNKKSQFGNTALINAADENKFEVVQLLVGYGAEVNIRNNDGATAASMAYDKGYVAIYNYLKENGAVDFDPLPQRAAAPPPPRASTSGSGGSGGSGGSSGADAAAAIAKSLGDGFKSPLESGVYRVSGAAEKMSITTMAKSGAVTYTDAGGKQSSGNLSIDGTRLIINLGGRTYIYTITSSTSFSNNGETWVRTGY